MAELVSSGNMLHGTARAGGAHKDGTVFAVSTDGTGLPTATVLVRKRGWFYPATLSMGLHCLAFV